MTMSIAAEATLFGQSAAVWSAVAAFGSLATAIVLAIVNHRLAGARPKVTVQMAAIHTDTGLYQQTLAGFRRRIKLPENALECVAVTIENRGRTPLTVDKPVFELRYRVWKPKTWWRLVSRRINTVGTTALPWPEYTSTDSARLDVGGRVRYLVTVAPLLGNPEAGEARSSVRSGLTSRRDWDYARMRVGTAGRRDKVARLRPIPAAPHREQLSGQPVTFRQFVSRWLILQLLSRPLGDDDAPDGVHSYILMVNGVAHRLERRHRSPDPISWAFIDEALKYAWPWPTTSASLSLGQALVDAGFISNSDLDSETPHPTTGDR